jgi:acyl-CoA thioesterase FadM
MARIVLEIPDRLPFATEITLRVSDINYGGHLGNDRVLSLVHEARIRFLKSLGLAERDACGVGLLMADAAVVYRSQAFHGEVIGIGVGAGDFSRTGCDFYFRLTNRETRREVALAKTGVVCFDYRSSRVAGMPEELRTKLAGG